MKELMTLEAARVNVGYKIKEAAPLLGVDRNTLSKYERDSTKVQQDFVQKVEILYKINRNDIFFGNRYEFFRRIRAKEIAK